MDAIHAVIEIEVPDKDWAEYASCVGEREFHLHMRNAWTLYAELGPNRKALARQVLGELEHIPKEG